MSQAFGTIFVLLTPHIDFIFCPNLVPFLGSLNTKVEIFLFNLYSPESSNKVFELLLYIDIHIGVQMQTITFIHSPPDSEYLLTTKQCNND